MKNLKRILPFLLCLVLTVSAVASCSFAYAAEADQSPPTVESGDSEGDSEAPVSTGMLDTTASLGKVLLDGIWSLFGVSVPGFDFTFGQMWLGVLLCSISILVVRMIFSFGGGSRGESPRTSSTDHPKISKERRHDEF